jgi:hypothetical protein
MSAPPNRERAARASYPVSVARGNAALLWVTRRSTLSEARQIASKIWRTHLAAKTPWGTEDNTGSASIDWVLLDATRPLSAKEILEEVRRRGLPERKDANPHLSTLKRKGFITNTAGVVSC